jgi:hypothetical protein
MLGPKASAVHRRRPGKAVDLLAIIAFRPGSKYRPEAGETRFVSPYFALETGYKNYFSNLAAFRRSIL